MIAIPPDDDEFDDDDYNDMMEALDSHIADEFGAFVSKVCRLAAEDVTDDPIGQDAAAESIRGVAMLMIAVCAAKGAVALGCSDVMRRIQVAAR